MLNWFAVNAVALGILGTAIGFLWSAILVVIDHRKESQSKEFEAYHRLVKELVTPDAETGSTRIDRQAAVIFELRNFPRYYDYTGRMLVHLRQTWSDNSPSKWPQLLTEIELTLSHIAKVRRKRCGCLGRLLRAHIRVGLD